MKRGVAFYRQHLFTSDHLPCYWADHLYPLEVQNCAQGIQTLATLASQDAGMAPSPAASASSAPAMTW